MSDRPSGAKPATSPKTRAKVKARKASGIAERRATKKPKKKKS